MQAGLVAGHARPVDAPAPAASSVPARLTLEALKPILKPSEGVLVQFTLTAVARTKVCLEKDPMSQVVLRATKAGMGLLPLKPLVVRDYQKLYNQRPVVRWLDPGQSVTWRTNLKRFGFADGQRWAPGEYSVQATFQLCEQSAGYAPPDPARPEIPIPSVLPAWFMISL